MDAHGVFAPFRVNGSGSRGAARGARREREPGPALPDGDLNRVAVRDPGKLHVGPVRIQRMALQRGAEGCRPLAELAAYANSGRPA